MRSQAWLAAGAAALCVLLVGCGYPDPSQNAQAPVAAVPTTGPSQAPGGDNFNEGAGKPAVKFPDGLQIVDLKVGTGDTVKPQATVNVQYTGWLSNGTKFDSSADHGGTPLCAILTNTQSSGGNCTSVIPGWNEGVPGMKVGGRRKLIIPSGLAYGDQGIQGVIPGGATLVFTVQLDAIVSNAPPPTPSPSPSAPAPSPTPTK
jgi:FKBP-type peptidyl-prolyl cis-trans isomerase